MKNLLSHHKKLMLAIMLMFCFILRANSFNKIDSLILKANKLYTENNFEAAIIHYTQVIDSGYVSGELFYNLGNAYFKLDKLGLAIVNYEKALLLKPNDEDIKNNIQLAYARIVDDIEIIPEFFIKRWTRKLVDITSSNVWAMISVSCFLLFLIFSILFLFSGKKRIKKISFLILIIFLIISSFSYYSSSKSKKLLEDPSIAIIGSASVMIKSSPNDYGKDLFVLHEGTKVSILDTIESWQQIKTSNGNKGWVNKKNLLEIKFN